MNIPRHYLVGSLLFGSVMLTASVSAAQRPPIPGVTGTIALPTNVDKFYSDLNKLLVLTVGGAAKDTKVEGESASLDSLRPGTPVVVQYTIKGIQTSAYEMDRSGAGSPPPNEGIVTTVDEKRVTIRFSDGGTQTLRYTSHATKWSAGDVRHGDRVVLYSTDPSGRRNTYYFKPPR